MEPALLMGDGPQTLTINMPAHSIHCRALTCVMAGLLGGVINFATLGLIKQFPDYKYRDCLRSASISLFQSLSTQLSRQTHLTCQSYHPHTNMQLALLSRAMAVVLMIASLAVAVPSPVPGCGISELECKRYIKISPIRLTFPSSKRWH